MTGIAVVLLLPFVSFGECSGEKVEGRLIKHGSQL